MTGTGFPFELAFTSANDFKHLKMYVQEYLRTNKLNNHLQLLKNKSKLQNQGAKVQVARNNIENKNILNLTSEQSIYELERGLPRKVSDLNKQVASKVQEYDMLKKQGQELFKIQKIKIEDLTLENKTLKEKLSTFQVEMKAAKRSEPAKMTKQQKYEIVELESKIKIMMQHKNSLENDISFLNSEFAQFMHNSSTNSKISLLMKFKEENYELKLKLCEMKTRYEKLEKEIIEIEDNQVRPEVYEALLLCLREKEEQLNNTKKQLNSSKITDEPKCMPVDVLYMSQKDTCFQKDNTLSVKSYSKDMSLISNGITSPCFPKSQSRSKNLEEFPKYENLQDEGELEEEDLFDCRMKRSNTSSTIIYS